MSEERERERKSERDTHTLLTWLFAGLSQAAGFSLPACQKLRSCYSPEYTWSRNASVLCYLQFYLSLT